MVTAVSYKQWPVIFSESKDFGHICAQPNIQLMSKVAAAILLTCSCISQKDYHWEPELSVSC